MDRRTFLRGVVASTGSLAVAGCLGEDDESVADVDGGPPRYDLPGYSGWPPTESYDGDGVVFFHLGLARLPALRRAVDDGRLTADQPSQALALSSLEAVPEAVETVESYPFAAALRRAINAGVGASDDSRTATGSTEPDAEDTETTNETLVDPIDDGFGANVTTNGSSNDTNPDTSTAPDNGTATGDENETSGRNQIGAGNRTETDEDDTVDVGMEVSDLTLTDGLLLVGGDVDPSVIANRYTRGFRRVDDQRGIEVYESEDDSGRAFGVAEDLLVVPIEADGRRTPAETVFAHGMSRYVSGVDRVVDDEDGRWLFETTGGMALGVGVWDPDEPIGRLADTLGEPPVEASGPVFGSVGSFVHGLDPVADDSGAIAEFETRFAGLFGDGAPTEDDLVSALAEDAAAEEAFVEEQRGYLTAVFDD